MPILKTSAWLWLENARPQPLKIGSKNMSHNTVLRWEFAPATALADANAGWGQGILYLFEQPFWYAGSRQTPQPIE